MMNYRNLLGAVLLVGLGACGGESASGTRVEQGNPADQGPGGDEATPVPADEVTPEPDPGALPPAEEPQTCLYALGHRPTAPVYPDGDCRREWRDPDGELTQYGERAALVVSGHGGHVLTIYLADGTPRRRVSYVEGPHGVVFEALETLYLDPLDFLPNTYGLPGTWSRTTTFGADGQLTEERYDIGMDGQVDSLEERTFDELGNLVEVRFYGAQGQLHRVERYGVHSRIEWDGDAEELSGRRYTYDASGLLVRLEHVTAGQVVKWHDIEELAPDLMLTELVTAALGGAAQFVSASTWHYHADGWLERFDNDRVVYGHIREERWTYDASGRELLFTEKNESPDCALYRRETVYHATADTILSAKTTCDGAPFEIIEVQVDGAGRPLVRERTWYGSPVKSPRTDVDTWTYDTCGAVTRQETAFGDNPPRIRDYVFDPQGRLVEESLTQFGGEPSVTSYAYDDAGRVTRAGSHDYAYDSEGRLSQVTSQAGLHVFWPDEDPPASTLTFDYVCPVP